MSVVLITGAAQGLGREVGRQLAAVGHDVVLSPGLSATWPGAVARGAGPVEQSAAGVVWAATLPDGGPTGGFLRDCAPLPW